MRWRRAFGKFGVRREGNRILVVIFTSWSRVFLEKLTVSAASQEIPCTYGTRKFITVFTSAHHLSLF